MNVELTEEEIKALLRAIGAARSEFGDEPEDDAIVTKLEDALAEHKKAQGSQTSEEELTDIARERFKEQTQ